MSSKKILWLIKGLGRGGAERLLETSIPYFNRKVFDYEVAYCLPWKNDVVPALQQANIPVFCLNLKSMFDLKGLYGLLRLIKERQPEILHIHLPYTGILGRVVGRMAGVKNIVYTEHNVIEKYHPLTRLLNVLTYPLNHTAIAVSEEVQRSMMRYWPSRQTNHLVINNGIELNTNGVSGDDLKKIREDLSIPATHKIIGNVAHIRPEKGHEYLLRAARLVVDRHPEVTFLIVGREKSNGEIHRLEEMAGSQGIKKNIIFTGFRQDVTALMSVFDLFVLSSLAEGLPLALLEAMLLGKPAVTTPVGGIPVVVKDGINGFLVPPRNPELLAEKILQLLQDDSLRATMSQRAIQTVREQFNIQEMVRKVEQVYSTVLSHQ